MKKGIEIICGILFLLAIVYFVSSCEKEELAIPTVEEIFEKEFKDVSYCSDRKPIAKVKDFQNNRCVNCFVKTQGNYFYEVSDVREVTNYFGLTQVDFLSKTNGCVNPSIETDSSYCYRQVVKIIAEFYSAKGALDTLNMVKDSLEVRKVVLDPSKVCPETDK